MPTDPKKPKKAPKSSKVFDVSMPGKGKVDIGSKPMIVGHRSVAADPMVREKEEAEAVETKITKLPSESKIRIEPISDDAKKDPKMDVPADDNADTSGGVGPADAPKTPEIKSESVVDNLKKAESDSEAIDKKLDEAKGIVATEVKPPEINPPEASNDKSDKKDDVVAVEDSSDDKSPELVADKPADTPEGSSDSDDAEKKAEKEKTKIDPVALAMEREDNLHKIIASKKYRVSVKEGSALSLKTVGLILVLILALLAVAYTLIDMGTIDVGVELPF